MTWLIPLLITLAGACLSHFVCNRWKNLPRVVHLDRNEKITAWLLFCGLPSLIAWPIWAYFKFWT